jgi:hypothetical protein
LLLALSSAYATLDNVAVTATNNALYLKDAFTDQYSPWTLFAIGSVYKCEAILLLEVVKLFVAQKKAAGGQRLKFGALRPHAGSNDAEQDETTT